MDTPDRPRCEGGAAASATRRQQPPVEAIESLRAKAGQADMPELGLDCAVDVPTRLPDSLRREVSLSVLQPRLEQLAHRRPGLDEQAAFGRHDHLVQHPLGLALAGSDRARRIALEPAHRVTTDVDPKLPTVPPLPHVSAHGILPFHQ
jgi:hypothetical protein